MLKRALIIAFLSAQFSIPSFVFATNECSGGYSDSIQINGDIEHPKWFTLDALRSYKSVQRPAVWATGKGVQRGIFNGVPLYDLISEAEIKENPERKNSKLRKYIVVTATDCYEVIFSMGELLPGLGNQQILLAYEKQNEAGEFEPLDEKAGMARLIVPGDTLGDRHEFNVKYISIRTTWPE